MRLPVGHMFAVAFGLASLAGAAGARAEQTTGNLVLASREISSQGLGFIPKRTLEWDSRKARWGLKLGVEQHMDRDVDWKDLQPGLYYRLTPRLHIGGAVSLAPDQTNIQRLIEPRPAQPRVRLETTFKF